MKEKIIFLIALFFIIFSWNTTIIAKQSLPTVNVLTWWGYLGHPEIRKKVQDVCHVDISSDEYYSNEEFLRRFKAGKQEYDIIIFSYTVYNLIKNEITLTHSDLWKQSNNYNPVIKKHYIEDNLPPNIVYFEHSLTGFLWNPKKINLTPTDSISAIFHKADNNITILLDDPIEINNLLKKSTLANISKNEVYLSESSFKSLLQNANVYIANGYNNIYNNPNFAFAYSWSGDAILMLQQNAKKSYRFLVHPKLSYITIDMLAALSNKPYVSCVAKVLSSKNVLDILQNKDYYFSPYTDIKNIPPGSFKDIYTSFLQNLPHLSWIKPASKTTFTKLNRTWEMIKINTYN
jgi:spermidine/putrescine-binding protein